MFPTWASSGHGSTEWAAGWPDLDLVSLVPTCASSEHGSSALPADWPHLDLVSGVATWVSHIPGDTSPHVGLTGHGESGPYLVLSETRGRRSPTGPHLDLVNLVPILASRNPGDFVPHLELIAVDSFLASAGTGDSDPICASPRVVTLVLTWA